MVRPCSSAGATSAPTGELPASTAKGAPCFGTLAIDEIGYDVSAIGDHDFDFGPDTLARFIAEVGGSTTFVSANLGFSGGPRVSPGVSGGTRDFVSPVQPGRIDT